MRKRVAKTTNGRMDDTTVRNNTDTNNISKFEKQEATSDPLESKQREQSDNENVLDQALGPNLATRLPVRPQFVDTLFIVRLRSNMSMRHAVIINY